MKAGVFAIALVIGATSIPLVTRATENVSSSSGSVSGSSASTDATTLEEVVVTAEKRSERLQDVPGSVTAISGDRLESLGINSISDLANYVPGITISNAGSPGDNDIIIRGLSGAATSGGSALVAVYVDGTAASSALTNYSNFDLNPYDLERIEVLQGPQGTLYGADAMGGVVNYVLRSPNLNQFEARIGGDLEHVNASGGVDREGRAAVNIPIIANELAVRVSGFYKDDAGYIDNLGTSIKDANHYTEDGVRATALWQPISSLSVKATVITENVSAADQTAVTVNALTMQPVYGPQQRFQYFSEPSQVSLRDYYLSINWDLGFASVISESSWVRSSFATNEDITTLFRPYVPTVPDALVNFLINNSLSKPTEELRLVSPEGQRLSWMVGAVVTQEKGTSGEGIPVYSAARVLLPANNLLTSSNSDLFRENGVFANATYKITDQVDITAGDRYSSNKETDCTNLSEGALGGSPLGCATRPYQSVSTWMGDIRYRPTTDAMLYARVSTGYRPGGRNSSAGLPGVPPYYQHDTTTNYEVGFKGETPDHRLQLDVTAFYIDWKNVQIETSNATAQYVANAGGAISSGFELSSKYALTSNLQIIATLDRTNAHLTRPSPGSGAVGDQLPLTALWTGSITADYRHSIRDNMSWLAGGGYRYRDRVDLQFAGTGEPESLVPQNIVDLYTGIAFDKTTIRLYGKNVFNNRSYTGFIYTGIATASAFVPVQPLTIGLSVDHNF